MHPFATLYYDGRCGLCRREIHWLQARTSRLRFYNIHELPSDFHGPSVEQLLAQLHLEQANGQWLIGLEAMVAAWQHSRWGWLMRPLLWPGLHGLATRAYAAWARQRFNRLGYCDL